MSSINRDYLPAVVALLLQWLEHFISVANANLADTGLTAGQIAVLNTLHTDLSTAYGVHVSARAASKAATETKNEAVRAAVAEARKLAQIVQKHPGASEALKIELGLTAPPAPHVPVEPVLPQSLTAKLNEIGWVTLKWDRNGNKGGTTFVIWGREGNSGPFAIMGTTTRSSFVDQGRTAGVQYQYCVQAVRSGRESGLTPAVSIYTPGEEANVLHIAA